MQCNNEKKRKQASEDERYEKEQKPEQEEEILMVGTGNLGRQEKKSQIGPICAPGWVVSPCRRAATNLLGNQMEDVDWLIGYFCSDVSG
jgi:hypothetical protein